MGRIKKKLSHLAGLNKVFKIFAEIRVGKRTGTYEEGVVLSKVVVVRWTIRLWSSNRGGWGC